MPEFIRRQRDRRLIVSESQYQEMIQEAKTGAGLYPADVFEQEKFARGDSHCYNYSEETVNDLEVEHSQMSQEVGIPEDVNDTNNDWCQDEESDMYLTGNVHNDIVASVSSLTGTAANNPELLEKFASILNVL